MATLTIGIADPLLRTSGFAGLDRSSSLTIMEGALLLGRSLCFVLVWHKADRLRQDCVVTRTTVVLLLALFCIVKAQKQACFVTL